jgi:hypothetical protein
MKELGPKGDQMAEIISPSDQAQQLQGLRAAHPYHYRSVWP